jgi:glycopeptide antibiotics resistance protein
MKQAGSGHLWGAGLIYLAFVVYGSLVPLDFRPMPLDQAIARFREVPFLQLGIGSRADWVANLLLFIPLTFLWTGALGHGQGLATRMLASLLVLAAAVALCLGIEFTQLFFPQRTVSQNDIFAEAVGGVLGIIAWWSVGPRWMAWYQSWHHAKAPADTAERLAWAYLLAVFAYGVLPLDLTLSGVEIFHKWREGKLNLVPFAALPGDPAHALYELASDALLWLPPALLWRLHGGRGGFKVWKMAFGAVFLLELLQLFVYSRVSDVTDLFTGALGAWAGGWLGGRMLGRHGRHAATASPQRAAGGVNWLPLGLALGWVGVLAAVFWYPFNFHTEGAFIRERMGFLSRVPFETYYYGTEFRAITEVFHKTLFFAPLGALLAWFSAGLPWLWRSYGAVASIGVVVVTALGIELGQVLLPEKYPDTTDWFLESLGGMLGYFLFSMLGGRLKPTPQRQQPMRRHK